MWSQIYSNKLLQSCFSRYSCDKTLPTKAVCGSDFSSPFHRQDRPTVVSSPFADTKQPVFITISTMSQQIEALSLGDAPNTVVVKLHPTVVFSVLNNFVRRSDRETRVIGTLLGTITNGVIEITECFGVPHMEKKDELFVAINKDYHKTMYNFHRRINRKEKIVGWYTTTSAEGALINDNSSLIHDFYSQECEHPVHIVVDTTLAGNVPS